VVDGRYPTVGGICYAYVPTINKQRMQSLYFVFCLLRTEPLQCRNVAAARSATAEVAVCLQNSPQPENSEIPEAVMSFCCETVALLGGRGGPPRVTSSRRVTGDTERNHFFWLNLQRTLDKRRCKAERVGEVTR